MANQSHYEINVSLNGRHFFSTNERSALDLEKAEKLVYEFRQAFPASKGYKVECTYWEITGNRIDFAVFAAKPKTLAELEAENPDGFRNPE